VDMMYDNGTDIRPLCGLTFAVKDLYDVAGYTTVAGTPALAGQPPTSPLKVPFVPNPALCCPVHFGRSEEVLRTPDADRGTRQDVKCIEASLDAQTSVSPWRACTVYCIASAPAGGG